METKKIIAFFCVLVTLFSLSSLSYSDNVDLNVKVVTSIATTDENFICATLDWWPSDKCDYDQCPWKGVGMFNLDLNNKVLSNAITAFNPLRIRLGGSVEDQIVYQFGGMKTCPQMTKDKDGLFGFSKGCLNSTRWDQINNFVNNTGVKLTFGLNALMGKKKAQQDQEDILWEGEWDASNAASLMAYTVFKGYKIDSYELGNELCGSGVSVRIESIPYAKDMTKLRKLVNAMYPNPKTRPQVLGPAGFYDKEWFNTFLQHTGPGVLDGVTHHIYNLGAGVDKTLINKIQDPYFLSQVAQTFKDISIAVKEYTPWAQPWVGESGGAYNSGGKDVSHTFADGFWYLDQLGMTSTFNHAVYCRQALVGGNYGLLNTTTFIPNPDYYGALLWHKLMGSKVLSVNHEGSPYLRTYAHCSKNNGGGVTLLLINMSNSTSFYVTVKPDMNLYPDQSEKLKKREEYHLTPENGNIQSDVVLLNGKALRLTRSQDIPAMKPVLVDPSSPIAVAADSIVFARLNNLNVPACV
ncbi:heparanase-like protein 1 [Prosopis cineraria]|uniref:heparanase-like protein 1 n=1 Tax=Prosopis cineraria TaxID=364024 RepID=UPI0024109A72|nr:heparanase-like protein 1 [Prosopis cineraria]